MLLTETWLFIAMAYKTGTVAVQVTEPQCRAAMIAVHGNRTSEASVFCIGPDGRRLTLKDVQSTTPQ